MLCKDALYNIHREFDGTLVMFTSQEFSSIRRTKVQIILRICEVRSFSFLFADVLRNEFVFRNFHGGSLAK